MGDSRSTSQVINKWVSRFMEANTALRVAEDRQAAAILILDRMVEDHPETQAYVHDIKAVLGPEDRTSDHGHTH